MKIWLVTTGSSDVQLKFSKYSAWSDWYPTIKQACHRLPFEPTQAVKDSDDSYRIAPRVLGMAYQAVPEEVWEALEFPLLKEFTTKLKDEEIVQIILLLTDQSQIFDESQRDDLKCPYWQDTCELQPIFKRYFQTHFPNIELVPLRIAPGTGESGLDDWNFVLDLVRSKLKHEISVDPTTVYVSHQAGTPAISSAVQFSSLARFRDDVQFLVSNEYHPDQTRTIPRSTYLRGIQQQEAKALLDRHDYSGVEVLVRDYLKGKEDIQTLLNAAIQWNFAKFDEFANEIQKLSSQEFQDLVQEVKERSQHWWWTAYEAAYLAWIRLEQGNTVEALFHSFRAAEGSISNWAKWYYPEDIKETKNGAPIAKHRANSHLPTYLTEKLFEIKNQELLLHSEELFKLLKETRPEITDNEDVKVIWNGAKNTRNQQFHRLLGLNEKEVFRAWGTKENCPAWKSRLRNCLNTIAEQTFESLEEASLMAKVHEELERAIASL